MSSLQIKRKIHASAQEAEHELIRVSGSYSLVLFLQMSRLIRVFYIDSHISSMSFVGQKKVTLSKEIDRAHSDGSISDVDDFRTI